MFLGDRSTDGLRRLVFELVTNSADEAEAGVSTFIEVALLSAGRCRVIDDGRGISTDPVPGRADMTTVEFVCRYLHVGRDNGQDGDIGLAVINAFSSEFEVEVRRDGQRSRLIFRDGGTLVEHEAQPGDGHGTSVIFRPDPSVFKDAQLSADAIVEYLRSLPPLPPGVSLAFTDERGASPVRQMLS